MSWTSALTDLRMILSDSDTSKPSWKKACYGTTDGTNRTFKTFDFRRLTDFTSCQKPLGVFVNGESSFVYSDDVLSGEFTLKDAPLDGDRVEASYYSQWFIDDELYFFLRMASSSLGLGEDYSGIPDGLRPSAIRYASADAYQELSVRYAKMISERFRAEDLPQERLRATIDSYSKLSESMRKQAITLRDDYYKRQGQSFAPAFLVISGNVRDVKPNR